MQFTFDSEVLRYLQLTTAGMIYNATITLLTFTFYTNMTTVILYYDFLLTLKDEMNLFWKRKWGFITFLFFANRYFAIVENTLVVLLYVLVPWSPTVSMINECMEWAPF